MFRNAEFPLTRSETVVEWPPLSPVIFSESSSLASERPRAPNAHKEHRDPDHDGAAAKPRKSNRRPLD